MTTPPASPLLVNGVIRELVHLCDGKQIREVLPDVAAALLTIEQDIIEDSLNAMDNEDEAS